jgi:hypothetical protein
MASSPSLKAYKDGEYLAAFKRAGDAAPFASFLGLGASIRFGHTKGSTVLLITEENEDQSRDELTDALLEKLKELID